MEDEQNQLPASRSPTPLHGFQDLLPVSGVRRPSSVLSPIGPTPKREKPRRRRQATRPLHPVYRTRAQSRSESSEGSSAVPRSRNSSPKSLEWDNDDLADEISPDRPNNTTSSTQFDVTAAAALLETNITISEDEFEEAETGTVSPPTSVNTVMDMDISTHEAGPSQPPARAPSTLPPVPDPPDQGAVDLLQALRIQGDPELKKALRSIKLASLKWNDDFSGVNASVTSADRLKVKIQQAEEIKSALQENILLLDDEEPAGWTPELSSCATVIKANFVCFIKYADKELAEIVNNPVMDPATSVKVNRVNKHMASLIEDINTVKMMLDSSVICLPDDEAGYLVALDRANSHRERAKSLIQDGKELASDATDGGLLRHADAIDTAVRELKDKDHEIATTLLDRKGVFGIIQHGSSTNKVEVPVPTFSGGITGLDFFSFKKEWDVYLSTKVLNPKEKFSVLTRVALKEQAFKITKGCETTEEIFDILKETYGNVRHLLALKIDEIRKLGPCKGENAKMREWIIDIKGKMIDVHSLAVDHSLTEQLYNSALAPEISGRLPPHMVKLFKKDIKAVDKFAEVSPQQYWSTLVDFLLKQIEHLTFEVNYAFNCNQFEKRTFEKKTPDSNPKKQNVFASDASAPSDSPSIDLDSKGASRTKRGKGKKTKDGSAGSGSKETSRNYAFTEPKPTPCPSCNGQHTHIYYCPIFQTARGKERIHTAAKSRSCFRCLRADSAIDFKNRDAWWKGHVVNCDERWICKFGKCSSNEPNKQYHFIMCSHHIEENKDREREFITELDKKLVQPGVRFFVNYDIYQFGLRPILPPSKNPNIIGDTPYPSIFMLQYIETSGQALLLFFDSGCSGSAVSDRASKLLNSITLREGPTQLNVAGAVTMEIEGGDETFFLPLDESEKVATITGLRMPSITNQFPCWDVATAMTEIGLELDEAFPGHAPLPPHPPKVGGECVDIMIGIRYARFFPRLLYMLPSGLGIYKTQFKAMNGQTCILGGPHSSWLKCKEEANYSSPHTFFSAELKAYYHACDTLHHVYSNSDRVQEIFEDELPDPEDGDAVSQQLLDLPLDAGQVHAVYQIDLDRPTVSSQVSQDQVSRWESVFFAQSISNSDHDTVCSRIHCSLHNDPDVPISVPSTWDTSHSVYSLKDDISRFLEGEQAGADVTYRCVACRNCHRCKQSETLESTSLREESEQALIEACVNFEPDNKRLVSTLPFILPPKENLLPNRYQAEKILSSQMARISKSEDMRADVLASYNKLADKGYFRSVASLSPDIQQLALDESNGSYIIPWRCVWKENSLSTPCRIVFDASSRTPGGLSLNCTLAKGQNRLNSLVNILMRFRCKPAAFSTDIRLAYNQISLDPNHLKFHKFLWKENLLDESPVELYVVMTMIYGVKPVGNSLVAGFSKLCSHVEKNHPEHASGADALRNSAYVDDVAHSDDSLLQSKKTAESLNFTLGLGNIQVKGYAFSGEDPPPEMSPDGEHVGLVGLAWAPKKDLLSIDIKPLYFGKPKRGKLPEFVRGDILSSLKVNFTRRNMLGKVASVFDPIGLVTPVMSRFKLDLHDLVTLKLGWDEKVPDEYLERWVRNLTDIQDLKEVKFRRAIIPANAVNTDVELIVSADASQNIAVACVHARVKCTDGSYSCQLLTAKSKQVKALTIPKAELRAAVLAAHVAHGAKFNLGSQLQRTTYVIDSSIVLFWLSTDERPLEVIVRNCVIDIRRFSSPSQWYHVDSGNNLADLGTRDAAVEDLQPDGEWQSGKAWMRLPFEQMPIKTVEQVRMSGEEKRVASDELKNNNLNGIMLPFLTSKVQDRYQMSSYLVDPCKYNWPKAVKVIATMIKYVKLYHPDFSPEWAPEPAPDGKEVVCRFEGKDFLTRELIKLGENYFFWVATKEVEKLCSEKEIRNTEKKGGIIYSTSRILDGQEILDPANVMLDVNPLSFVKPVVDRYSPVAYSIMSYSHVKDGLHRSASATLRESRNHAYILRGRDLANEVRAGCRLCTRFKAKLVEVEMGKISQDRLCIAPAFYHCQCDLFGPWPAQCQHNHRSVVKVWGCVFKCPATGAIAVYAMPGYSTDHFLQCYTRFSSRYGHPQKLMIDEGSQLKLACKAMEMNITDITNQLFNKYSVGIEFRTTPVGGHNQNGVVERSIRSVKELYKKVFTGIKMDIMLYETAFAWISNQLNNLPICIGNRTQNLDSVDLITPSRLLLGRASTRASGGYARIEPPSKLVQKLDLVYDSWWNTWEKEKLTDFIPQPRQGDGASVVVGIGDIVLILMNPDEVKLGGPVWRIGRVVDVEVSDKDGHVRVATCEYRLPNEKVFRKTRRSVRKLAVVHQEHDLDLVQELNQAAKSANVAYITARDNVRPASFSSTDRAPEADLNV